MEQEELFFDGPHDALAHLVRVLGGAKRVGCTLRPGKSPDAAGVWLTNALSGDRREQLHLDDLMQLLRMGRDAGCHVVMEELSRALAYSAPQPIEPEDQRALLEREFINSVKVQQQILQRLERITSAPMAPRRVHG